MEENYIGTLNDLLIEQYCKEGFLITENYKKVNIKQACYELTASCIYYNISENFNRIDIKTSNYSYILIKPRQSVVIITKEYLVIPNNIIGRVLTKGKLFSIGLLPVNTYADPGFEGNLGIILNNNSTNYLKLCEDDAIAKIEFSQLQAPVSSDYAGQHGYNTRIWPIPVEYGLSQEEIKSDPRIGSIDNEISSILGEKYSNVIKRLLTVEKKLILAFIAYLSFSFILFGVLQKVDAAQYFSPFWIIILGLITNLISTYLLNRFGK